MAVLSITALKAQINADIITNGIKAITGSLLNTNLIDMVDSIVDAEGSIYDNDGTFGSGRSTIITDNLNFSAGLFYLDKENDAVGFGTADPFNSDPIYGGDATYHPRLVLETADDRYGLSHNNGTQSIGSYLGGGKAYFGTISNHDLIFMANDTTAIEITAIGNVKVSSSFTVAGSKTLMGSTVSVSTAALEVTSTAGGILFPRLTGAQAAAISGTNGEIIYVIDTGAIAFPTIGFWGYENSIWNKL